MKSVKGTDIVPSTLIRLHWSSLDPGFKQAQAREVLQACMQGKRKWNITGTGCGHRQL
jgi:hypothetical protein